MKHILLLVAVLALTGCPSHEAQHAAMAARAQGVDVSGIDDDDSTPVKVNAGGRSVTVHED